MLRFQLPLNSIIKDSPNVSFIEKFHCTIYNITMGIVIDRMSLCEETPCSNASGEECFCN